MDSAEHGGDQALILFVDEHDGSAQDGLPDHLQRVYETLLAEFRAQRQLIQGIRAMTHRIGPSLARDVAPQVTLSPKIRHDPGGEPRERLRR